MYLTSVTGSINMCPHCGGNSKEDGHYHEVMVNDNLEHWCHKRLDKNGVINRG